MVRGWQEIVSFRVFEMMERAKNRIEVRSVTVARASQSTLRNYS